MFKVYITENFDQMSDMAAKCLLGQMVAITANRDYHLGLATGNSPTGLYDRIVAAQDRFDAGKVRSWNLDEYVGLPGETASERTQHPESYAYFMISRLFGRLDPTFAERHVPPGTEIDQKSLELAIQEAGVPLEGTDRGKAVRLNGSMHPYLNHIQTNMLDRYLNGIPQIDTWIVGVGGRGHIAFHESGIPLDYGIMLVRLDDSTVDNAVADGHFASRDESPRYAISMGAGGVVNNSKNVLLLANGGRKTEPIAASLLGGETADVPISILQRNIGRDDRHTLYIVDALAAAEILGKEKLLADKGITVKDLRT
ncbi:MAG: 6-phosphogluconolactonase [archaeon]